MFQICERVLTPTGKDEDGYYWIKGRVDDVINVSGHRLSTAEVESALILHPGVSESAVVGANDEITGQAVYAFVTMKPEFETSGSGAEAITKELSIQVRKVIGPFASPKKIFLVEALPKTRSGKLVRRILRKIITKEADSIGDLSTVEDPSVVEGLTKQVYSAMGW